MQTIWKWSWPILWYCLPGGTEETMKMSRQSGLN